LTGPAHPRVDLRWFPVDGFASYEGTSAFLRWWPKVLLGFAVAIVVFVRVSHSLQWAALLALCAFLHGRMLPWQFSVHDEGLELVFPFGRRVFLPKPSTTVRLESVGAVAMTEAHRHRGYLLHDGVLFEPGQRLRLRRAFDFYGYRVV
jgi:hypothetical protein